jgi:hypothetical protein
MRGLLGVDAAGADNSTNVTLAGQNYLSLTGQQITAGAIDLSGTNVTGALAAARFPALTGDITTTAGSLTTAIAAGVVNFSDINYTNTLASNPALGANQTFFGSTGILFEGTTADAFEGLLVGSVTASDKTWTLPDVTGTIALTTSAMTGTFDGNNFGGGAIGVGDLLYGSAAGTIAERAIGTAGQVLQVNGGLPTWVATSSLGIASGVTFSNSAQLAALLSDETGTGNVVFSASPTLTGTLTAAATNLSSTLSLTGSAANIALGSNWLSGDGGDEGISVDGSGNVGIGTSTPNERLSVDGNIALSAGADRSIVLASSSGLIADTLLIKGGSNTTGDGGSFTLRGW